MKKNNILAFIPILLLLSNTNHGMKEVHVLEEGIINPKFFVQISDLPDGLREVATSHFVKKKEDKIRLVRLVDSALMTENEKAIQSLLDTYKIPGDARYKILKDSSFHCLITIPSSLSIALMLLDKGARIDIDKNGIPYEKELSVGSTDLLSCMKTAKECKEILAHPCAFSKKNLDEHCERAASYINALNKMDAQKFDSILENDFSKEVRDLDLPHLTIRKQRFFNLKTRKNIVFELSEVKKALENSFHNHYKRLARD